MADRETIKALLRELPTPVAAGIGLRAAMRVFPVLASRYGPELQPFAYWRQPSVCQHLLAMLRCYQLSHFVIRSPSFGMKFSTIEEVQAAAKTASIEAFGFDARYAAHIASAAAYAVASATYKSNDAFAAIDAAITGNKTIIPAIQADLQASQTNDWEYAMFAKPLWLDGIPESIHELWQQLQKDLRDLDADFGVWIDWYEGRLGGQPLNTELERKWALLPDDILKLHPAEINAHLKLLQDQHNTEGSWGSSWGSSWGNGRLAEPQYPDVPAEQEPGLQFATAPDGRIDLKPSGIAPPDDLAEIAAMRGAICEALDDLTSVLDGSNAHSTIIRVAMRYKTAINADELSIDLLYSYGVRLENANARFKAEIASGDCPDMAVPAGEALDSVLALHGPVVYSTERGRELIERAREYARQEADLVAYQAKSELFADAVAAAKDAITDTAREAIKAVNEDFEYGPHKDYSNYIARSANENILIAKAKILVSGIALGAAGSIAGNAIWLGTPEVLAAMKAFFITNGPLLREFAIIPGFEIRWLPAFLNWLEAQRAKRK